MSCEHDWRFAKRICYASILYRDVKTVGVKRRFRKPVTQTSYDTDIEYSRIDEFYCTKCTRFRANLHRYRSPINELDYLLTGFSGEKPKWWDSTVSTDEPPWMLQLFSWDIDDDPGPGEDWPLLTVEYGANE